MGGYAIISMRAGSNESGLSPPDFSRHADLQTSADHWEYGFYSAYMSATSQARAVGTFLNTTNRKPSPAAGTQLLKYVLLSIRPRT